jgi:hypothetical protein
MPNIKFEFIGGPNDGNIFNGTLGDGSDAERYYLFTNHGAVGQRFRVASEYAVETLTKEQLKEEKRHNFQRHFYVVTDRVEDDDEVCVRAEYVPEAAKSSRSSL